MNLFSVNAESVDRARVIEIGESKEHRILLIDDFFAEPDAVRAAALEPGRHWILPTGGYPGLLAQPEPEYLGELRDLLPIPIPNGSASASWK